MSGLQGDPKTLRAFARSLVRAGGVATAQRVAKRVAPELTALAGASFDAGGTPYGDPWAPGVGGQDVDLHETGALRRALKFEPVGTRVRAVLGVRHAKYQVGKRAVLPPGGRSLPATWRDRINEIAREEIAAALGGED